jgi:hypothetical protein
MQYALPEDNRQSKDPIVDSVGTGRGDYGWTSWWYPGLRNAAGPNNAPFDDSQSHFSRSLPVMGLFDLLPTVAKRSADDTRRFNILRRGVRHINLSQVVSNGQMLVLAVAEKVPLPYPFIVDGDPYGGDGNILYEFVIPLDRTPPQRAIAPSTSPATRPASGPTTKPATAP